MRYSGLSERRGHLVEDQLLQFVSAVTDIEFKRAWVADMYPGPRWKKKVEHMSDGQVIAIYMREHEHPHGEPKRKKESDSDDIPF